MNTGPVIHVSIKNKYPSSYECHISFLFVESLRCPGGEIAIVVWCGVYFCSNAKLFLKISQYFGLVKFFVCFVLVFFPPVNIFCPFHNVMALISLFFLFNTMHIFDLLPCLPLSSNGSACWPTPQQAFSCVFWGREYCDVASSCLPSVWITFLKVMPWYAHNSLVNKRQKVKC